MLSLAPETTSDARRISLDRGAEGARHDVTTRGDSHPRLHPLPERPARHADARRHGRRGAEGGAARRRRPGPLGHAAARRLLRLLRGAQPRQAQHHARTAQRRGARGHPQARAGDRRDGGELPSRRHGQARHRLRRVGQAESEADLRGQQRLRAGGRMEHARLLRSRRAGHERGARRAGRRTGRRAHLRRLGARRPGRRDDPRLRRDDGAARPRALRRGPEGRCLPARRDDLAPGLLAADLPAHGQAGAPRSRGLAQRSLQLVRGLRRRVVHDRGPRPEVLAADLPRAGARGPDRRPALGRALRALRQRAVAARGVPRGLRHEDARGVAAAPSSRRRSRAGRSTTTQGWPPSRSTGRTAT